MIYDALDIARYVINYSQEIGYPISNLKLQKLLYFIQGFFLALTEKECFFDIIEAWGFGPVVPSVYHEFKEFGSNNIPKIVRYFAYNTENPWESKIIEFDDSIINRDDKKMIQKIVGILKQYSATTLVKMTHLKGSPWETVYRPNQMHVEIKKEDIKRYFKERYLNETK